MSVCLFAETGDLESHLPKCPDDVFVLTVSVAWSCTRELPLVGGRLRKAGCKHEHTFPTPARVFCGYWRRAFGSLVR